MDQKSHLQQSDIDKIIPLEQPDIVKHDDLNFEDQRVVIPSSEMKLSWDIKPVDSEIGMVVNTIEELRDALKPGQVWVLENPTFGNLKYLVISANQGSVNINISADEQVLQCSIAELAYRAVSKFHSPNNPSDWCLITKDSLPATLIEIIEPDDFSEVEASNIQSNLYHDEVYTVIPKDHKIEMGIFPEDQHFSSKYVFVWDTYRDVLHFSDIIWDVVKITIPQGLKHTVLKPMVGGAYSLTHIPNTWQIEAVSSQPIYE
ncbi:MAG: hypothetical protein WC979_08350 [Candidatus Pacearchaeota archaeon]|jgi:hypothetical protein